MKQMTTDVVIIGAGIVGAATAMQLKQQQPSLDIVVIDKEPLPAKHQTGRNSGVIHAGVYYQPDSLKAKFCKQGAEDIKAFCKQHQIEYDCCGKLIVATNDLEVTRLKALFENCKLHQLTCHWLDQDALLTLEPNIIGRAAIRVEETGIVDYKAVCSAMLDCFVLDGGQIEFNQHVTAIKEHPKQVNVQTQEYNIHADYVICCGGLQADRLVAMSGQTLDFQIVPFRGEYFQLPAQRNDIIKHLIYPVPDPQLPFLGVHLTKMIDGSITVGPNAVAGFKREGYGRFNFSWKDSKQMLSYAGFWRLLKHYKKSALQEFYNTWHQTGYLAQVQKYCPQLKLDDLQPYPTGIRAQAVMNDGTLQHDFLFKQSDKVLHVCNAPSPAATSSLPIGRYIIDKLNRMQQQNHH